MASRDELTDDTLASGPAARSDEPRPGDVVGGYTIEQILGAGGMGIVYAAHDPDLDRRIALKILRPSARLTDQTHARARLLREARAMAKLSHPNVITVHEVGTDGARDYVAMERIDGRNVADWLASERRPTDEVLRVFLAAGRGLAAAHRAGLVHRDFKPHNVLLGRDGRVVVTDFGLARAYEGDAAVAPTLPISEPAARAVALDETLDAQTTPRTRDASSLSSTLTATGAMLGTPAYMAPEQFAGAPTGPETDQFSFCVALWEGLAGERPFRGGSIDELRRAVEAAPTRGVDKIPRRIRAALERGMSRDPGARWPSMDALLAAIEPPLERIGVFELAAIAALIIGVLGVALYVRGKGDVAPVAAACAPAIVEQWPVWSPGRAAELAPRFAGQPGWPKARAAFDAFAEGWRTTWDQACREPEDPHFHARIACLTDALDELAGLTAVLEKAPPEALRSGEVAQLIAPPETCLDDRRVGFPALPTDPDVRKKVVELHRQLAVARTWARFGNGDDAKKLAAEATADARALEGVYPAGLADALEANGTVLHILGEKDAADRLYEEAARVAERSGNDPVRAMALLGRLEILAGRTIDVNRIRAAADEALAAIARAGDDPTLRASVEIDLANVAAAHGELDDAIERMVAARETLERAGDDRRAGVAARTEADFRILRSAEGDAERAIELLDSAHRHTATVFGPKHPRTREAAGALARARWSLGDLEGAHALFAQLEPESDPPATKPRREVKGRVVDGAGTPVAGAKVYAATAMVGDARAMVVTQLSGRRIATATTDADGRFQLQVATPSLAVAEAGPLRSLPVPIDPKTGELVVRVTPTGAVEGRSELTVNVPAGDDPELALARRARVVISGLTTPDIGRRFDQLAPSRHATWSLPSVAAGGYNAIAVATTLLGDMHQRMRKVPVRARETTLVELPVRIEGVIVDVIVRGERAAKIDGAEVHIIAGKRSVKDVEALFDAIQAAGGDGISFAAAVADDTRTRAGRDLYIADDLHARISGVAPGTATICVIPLAGDVADTDFMRRLTDHTDDLEVICRVVDVTATPAVQAFVVEVPAPKRVP
jgi:tetratricopeptide (TPR) repeat protein